MTLPTTPTGETVRRNQTVRLDAMHYTLAQRLQETRQVTSFQQLVERLLEEEDARQEQTWGAVAAGIVANNQELFDRLADL